MPIILDPPPPTPPGTPPPGTPAELGSAADRFYRGLAPYHELDAENGFLLQGLCAGFAAPLEILQVATDTDTHIAWGTVVDPDVTPAQLLPWLAQFSGDRLLPSESEQQQRDRITSPGNFLRGTVDAIRAEVQPTLTGALTVLVLERTSTPWTLTVVTRTSETPDPAATERAARRQKASGLLMSIVVSDDPIIDEGGAARTIDVIGSAGTTIDGIAVADWT